MSERLSVEVQIGAVLITASQPVGRNIIGTGPETHDRISEELRALVDATADAAIRAYRESMEAPTDE